jgi:hypothetical protein
MGIERPNWDFEQPASEHEMPLPDGKALVPAAGPELSPNELVAQLEAYESGSVPVLEMDGDEADATEGLTSAQVEAAKHVAWQILSAYPDPQAFAASFDELPTGVQAKCFALMAARPDLCGLDLLDQLERKLTLEEQFAMECWLEDLSQADKLALLGGQP